MGLSERNPVNPPTTQRRALVATTSALLALGLTACGTAVGETERDGTEGSAGGASADAALPDGWTWIEGTDLPHVESTPDLPVTVTDGTDASVEVADASEIIVGGEDVADILAALGLQKNILAAPTNSVAPAALTAPEQFELSQKTGSEGLLSVDGSLFIGNNVKRHGEIAAQFRNAEVDAVVVDDQQPVVDKIREVGRYVGAGPAGEELASAVEAQLAEAAEAAADTGAEDLTILAVTASGAGGANAVMGTGTASADIIEATGATSVGVAEGLRGYSVEYSDEGLLGTEPDVILTGDGDLEEWGGVDGFLEAFPTLAETPAMQNGDVLVMPSEQIKVSGVGVGAGATALAEALASIER